MSHYFSCHIAEQYTIFKNFNSFAIRAPTGIYQSSSIPINIISVILMRITIMLSDCKVNFFSSKSFNIFSARFKNLLGFGNAISFLSDVINFSSAVIKL